MKVSLIWAEEWKKKTLLKKISDGIIKLVWKKKFMQSVHLAWIQKWKVINYYSGRGYQQKPMK